MANTNLSNRQSWRNLFTRPSKRSGYRKQSLLVLSSRQPLTGTENPSDIHRTGKREIKHLSPSVQGTENK